ncbi:unnamed protein product [Phytophthora lilii]|uniref:Unnamed protein product n=1 Tax=Phytophthora lilii TaxID=2077276 RepID=A0A9W7D884_9STRA|nr:unnamed protein product [Phytophthora lilii]
MYRKPTISSDVPAPKLTKAFKTGKLSLTADQLKGSGSVIHLHPASYEKAIKARKTGRGVRLDITRHEVKKGYKRAQGGSYSDVDKERGRVSVADVKKAAKSALGYAKRKRVLIDLVDAGERYLLSKATKPEHEHLVKSLRGEVRRRYGVGVAKKGR